MLRIRKCAFRSALGIDGHAHRRVDTAHVFLCLTVLDHDGENYIAVPHKNELELGKRFTLRFAEDFPGEDTERVTDYFHGRSAYRKFKDLLERLGLLQRWYEYESEATGKALRERANEAGLQLND